MFPSLATDKRIRLTKLDKAFLGR